MRVQVPFGTQSLKVVDSTGGRKGFSIQNVGAVDIYYSDDQRTLDSVGPANLPSAGHLLAAATPVLPPVVYPWFYGAKIFVRAQAAGALLEIIIYDVDLPCS
jgi:hypothetical protein